MHFKLQIIPAAVAAALLAACGGGGGTDSGPNGTPTSGKAVDGYLSFAKVVCDSNDNRVADTGEPVTYTDVKGNFVFNTGCSHGVLASGGISADTGLAFVGQLRAPAGATVVTPLTTLIASGMTQAEVNKALNLPADTNLLTTDPAATNSTGELINANLMKKTVAVQQMLQKTTELFTGLGAVAGSSATAAVYTEVAAAFATQLMTGGPLFDNGGNVSSSKVNILVSAAATRTSTATAVSTDIKTALAAAGSGTLATVAGDAITGQAQAIVSAANADITAVTKDRQSNTTITDNVKTEVSAGRLKSDTSPSALQSMKEDVAAKAIVATVDTTTPQHVPTPATGSNTLLTFDETAPAFSAMGAYGGALPSVEAGPSSDAGAALKIVKPTGAKEGNDVVTWGGTYFGVSAIPFAANRKTLTAAVYSTKANAVIKLKVEGPGATAVEVAGTSTGAANTWSTVTWNLSGVNASKQYTTIAITPDADAVTSGQSYYFDFLALAPAAGPTPTPQHIPTPATDSTTLLTFDESSPAFTGMNAYGGALPTIETPSGSDGGAALKILKPTGAKEGNDVVTWGGAYFGVSAIPFAANRKTLTAAVYSTKANAVIKLKVEGPGATAVEVAGTSTGAANTWSTVTWNLSGVNASKQYTTIAITPDADAVTSGQSYYIDNLALLAAEASAAPTDYVYLDSNSIGFSANGTTAAAVTYSMADFQSSSGGINIKWPMSNAAALKLKLKVNGNFSFDANQTLSAAVRIEEVGGGKGEIRTYTDQVAVSRSGDNITLSVPNLPQALIYGVSSDGQTKAVIDFSSKVHRITNTLSTASSAVSTVMFGEVVNFGINGLSNQFNNMSAMRGKYKVTIVVNELPLRKADGTKFDTLSIDVPTTVSGGVAGSPIAVTGYGLLGYINLTD